MTLTSKAYKDARKIVKDKGYATKRLKLLFVRVLTRIEKITIYLGEDEISDKDLKMKISLLSTLLEVKKKIKIELKELLGEGEKPEEDLGNILK